MYKLIRPLLFAMDPERAHERMIGLGEALANSWAQKFLARSYSGNETDPALETALWGLRFKSPVGLAAGFDKNGRLVDFLPSLGFGFLEVGTVTPVGQTGNDRPRLFRLPQDEGIVNRMGFNNEGAPPLALRLQRRRTTIPVGANIGKNKATSNELAVRDYERCFKVVADYADYITVNVSSPNTPNLRELQEKDSLRTLLVRLSELNHARRQPLPLLLKIAPDLSAEALADVATIVRETALDGIIATNTTITRNGLRTRAEALEEIGAGGLSGRPLRWRATEIISFLYKQLGPGIPIIGTGGIFSAADAYEKIRAGASLVQVWTGLIYEGPGLVRRINKDLAAMLRRDGFDNIQEAVGADSRNNDK